MYGYTLIEIKGRPFNYSFLEWVVETTTVM